MSIIYSERHQIYIDIDYQDEEDFDDDICYKNNKLYK